MNKDIACEHMNFAAEVDVNRLLNDTTGILEAFNAELRINCAECGEKFRFIGVKAGMLPTQPMCNITEDTLNIPIRPASSDPDFGLGIPGYSVRAY